MKGFSQVRARREQNRENREQSKRRCDLWGDRWEWWTVEEAARYFADQLGPAAFAYRVFSKDGAKVRYLNNGTGWMIERDVPGNYFTIHNERGDYVAKDGDADPDGRNEKYHFRIRTTEASQT